MYRANAVVIVIVDNSILKVASNHSWTEFDLLNSSQGSDMGATGDAGQSASAGALSVSTWERFLLVAVVVKIRHGSAESGLGPLGSGRLGHFDYFWVSNGDCIGILVYAVPSSLCAYRQTGERRARAHHFEMLNMISATRRGQPYT